MSANYLPIPAGYTDYEGGCKVCWYTYATEAEAIAASLVARHNAAIDAAAGYDFGFQSPGAIHEITGESGTSYRVTFS